MQYRAQRALHNTTCTRRRRGSRNRRAQDRLVLQNDSPERPPAPESGNHHRCKSPRRVEDRSARQKKCVGRAAPRGFAVDAGKVFRYRLENSRLRASFVPYSRSLWRCDLEGTWGEQNPPPRGRFRPSLPTSDAKCHFLGVWNRIFRGI